MKMEMGSIVLAVKIGFKKFVVKDRNIEMFPTKET